MGASEPYRRLAAAIEKSRLPVALVDLDAVDHNIDFLTEPVRAAGKTLRIASKSIRCVELLKYIQRRAPDVVQGIMCYATDEARFLHQSGFDDLLLAYPTVQAIDLHRLALLNRHGGQTSTVVDCREQVEALGREAARVDTEIPVVIDVDVSYRPLKGALHLGVRRSPILTVEGAVELAEFVRQHQGVRLLGLMAYEAQIAGLGDNSPYAPALNPVKALLRRLARKPVEERRAQLHDALQKGGFDFKLFNGGGTGSLHWASQEAHLSELTAGSGFLDSHLFDYFAHLHLQPAIFFALQVTRRPAPGYVTCHGGGYVASGEPGPDRLPRPWLPSGLELLGLEGAGEVQTPLRVPPDLDLPLGAPVFFRPAKAGELAEHFTEYLFCRDGEVVERARTYRGEGERF